MAPHFLGRMRRLRWTAFGLVSAAYVLSFFHRIAPAAIAGELKQAFQASGAALGALAATYFSAYTVMQIPTGVLVDTLGPRRIVTLGGVVAGAGSVLFGLARSLGAAAAGRALVGLGVSVAFISLLKLNAAWFRDREFATLAGLTLFLGNIGSVLSAAPLAWVVGATSWRNVFAALGLFSILLGGLTWFLVRDHPGEAGLPSMRELEGKTAHPPHLGRWYQGLWLVVKNRATWPGFFLNMGVGGTFLAFAGLWAVPYLGAVHGMDRTLATYHTSLMLVGFAAGSLGAGAVSDRMGRRRPVMLALGSAYLLCWLPWILGRTMPLPASLALFAAMGSCASAFTVTWASAKEVNPPALSGMATSLVNTGVFLGPTLYQPLVGWVLDRGWEGVAAPDRGHSTEDFRLGVAVLAAFGLMGLVSALFVRETHCRNVTVD